MVTVNANSGLESWGGRAGRSAASALTLALHDRAVLAGLDAVTVAFEDFLGHPSNEGGFVVLAVKLGDKLRFKLLNVSH